MIFCAEVSWKCRIKFVRPRFCSRKNKVESDLMIFSIKISATAMYAHTCVYTYWLFRYWILLSTSAVAHSEFYFGGRPGQTTRDSLILCLAPSFGRLIQLRSFSLVFLFVWGEARASTPPPLPACATRQVDSKKKVWTCEIILTHCYNTNFSASICLFKGPQFLFH